jgi:purine-binding chemotaxis protein CheW
VADQHQYCTFFLDGYYFGIDVLRVQEVVRYRQITRAPLAHPVVRGLINLRGQIVTALDLRRRLALPDALAGARPINVVIHTDDGPLSLLVDEIGDVLTVPETAFVAPPETLRGQAREVICGAYKLERRLLLILSVDAVLNITASPGVSPST